MKDLLEAGVHFGHQTKRWNPKMKPYIFGQRNGIYIIDLQQTVNNAKKALDFVTRIAGEGGAVLFVGTKRQAQEAITEEAGRAEMPSVSIRWLGGTLTNFTTIKKRIERLRYLESLETDSHKRDLLTKKEIGRLEKERVKLDKVLAGIKDMSRLPEAVFVIDPKKEHIAVSEARKLSIPVIAIVDTNCDPDLIDFVIPGNDDAIRAIRLFAARIADAVIEGRSIHKRKTAEAAAEEDSGNGGGDGKPGSRGASNAASGPRHERSGPAAAPDSSSAVGGKGAGGKVPAEIG